MTPQELENIERAFDKAKMQGPQALHDWAVQYAPGLFAEARNPGLTRLAATAEKLEQDCALDDRLVDALRPFAALGAPVCLTALEEHRVLNDVADDVPAFAVPDPNGPGAIASVTAEQLKAAHDLINEIDGGGGA